MDFCGCHTDRNLTQGCSVPITGMFYQRTIHPADQAEWCEGMNVASISIMLARIRAKDECHFQDKNNNFLFCYTLPHPQSIVVHIHMNGCCC